MTYERLDVDQVLQQLTVNDKVLLLSGRGELLQSVTPSSSSYPARPRKLTGRLHVAHKFQTFGT